MFVEVELQFLGGTKVSVQDAFWFLESGRKCVCVGNKGGLCRGLSSLWWCLKYALKPRLLLTKMRLCC